MRCHKCTKKNFAIQTFQEIGDQSKTQQVGKTNSLNAIIHNPKLYVTNRSYSVLVKNISVSEKSRNMLFTFVLEIPNWTNATESGVRN